MTVSDITKDSAIVKWSPPESDGGAEIMGYNIEIKPSTSGVWQQQTTLVKTTDFTLTELKTFEKYKVRITAVNKAGPGDWSEPSEEFTAKDAFGTWLRVD